MDFTLPQEDRRLLERATALAAEFAPRAREYDDAATFPAADFELLREAGFLKLTVPQELGGHGMWCDGRFIPFYLILETLARGSASTAQLVQIQSHATGIIG